jgi:outer membrane cobalamin receptor
MDIETLNITTGVRSEDNEYAGSSTLPRLALTKTLDKFHTKLMLSKAFRTPTLYNINRSLNIKPEKATTSEVEVGYMIDSSSFVSMNFFNIEIQDPIRYKFATIGTLSGDYYDNGGKTGTRGIELEYKFKTSTWWASTHFAYYNPIYTGSENSAYLVPVDQKSHLGLANQKVGLVASFNVVKDFSINPSLNYLGTRYTYSSNPYYDGSEQEVKKVKPTTLLNLNFLLSNLGHKNLDLSLSIFNLLDQKYTVYSYARPSYHEGLPAASREVVARLNYIF